MESSVEQIYCPKGQLREKDGMRYKFTIPMTTQTLIPRRKLVSKVKTQEESSPFIVEFFMVQGIGYRCMAYCDEDGKWRNAFNNGELYGDIRILE